MILQEIAKVFFGSYVGFILELKEKKKTKPVSEKTIKPLQSTGVLGGEKFLVSVFCSFVLVCSL